MKYMKLKTSEREDLLADLEDMPVFLSDCFINLDETKAKKRSNDGGFSPIEHVWHLADLEQEGFTVRLQKLLNGNNPTLPDFAGGKIAKERDYRSLSLNEGLNAFASARKENIKTIKTIEGSEWFKEGNLEGVGSITLCDMPEMLYQHDFEHKQEIEAWVNESR